MTEYFDKEDYLDVTKKYSFNRAIIEDKYIAIQLPTQGNLNETGDHVFSVPKGNKYVHIHKSYLHIEGEVLSSAAGNPPFTDADNITLINNAMMYLFSSAEYQLNGQQIELINNPGQVTTMMNLLKKGNRFNDEDGLNMCWNKDTSNTADINEFEQSVAAPGANYRPKRNINYNKGFDVRKRHLFNNISEDAKKGKFSFNIDLRDIFGFCESYIMLMYGLEHTLKFHRKDNGANALLRVGGVVDGVIKLSKFIWYIPNKKLSLQEEIIWQSRAVNNEMLSISYNARISMHLPLIAGVGDQTLNLTASGGIERPDWIIVALQT